MTDSPQVSAEASAPASPNPAARPEVSAMPDQGAHPLAGPEGLLPAADRKGQSQAANPPAEKAAPAPNAKTANPPANPPAEKAAAEKPTDPDNDPISDWSKVDLRLPEGVNADPALMESLGKVAMKAGLTAAQVRSLAHWQIDAQRQQLEDLRQSGCEELARAWGQKAEANRMAALALVTRVDRALAANGQDETAFSKALCQCGADMRVDIVKGLYEISRWLSEDSLGRTEGLPPAQKPETAYEGLAQALEQAWRGL